MHKMWKHNIETLKRLHALTREYFLTDIFINVWSRVISFHLLTNKAEDKKNKEETRKRKKWWRKNKRISLSQKQLWLKQEILNRYNTPHTVSLTMRHNLHSKITVRIKLHKDYQIVTINNNIIHDNSSVCLKEILLIQKLIFFYLFYFYYYYDYYCLRFLSLSRIYTISFSSLTISSTLCCSSLINIMSMEEELICLGLFNL